MRYSLRRVLSLDSVDGGTHTPTSSPTRQNAIECTPRSCLVLREELNERRVRNAQYRILAALICPGRSAFPAEIKYTRPTFKKADDLLGGNLQPLRDFRRRKVFRQCWEACR